MDVVCPHCNALFFRGEHQACCKDGQLCDELLPKLVAFEEIPDALKQLYDGESELSKEFFQNIRLLNSIFSFTSLGISKGLTREQAIQINSSLGGFSIVIHGQIFHQISPLLPRPGTERTGAQVLFFDSHWEELHRRGELCKQKKAPVSEELLKLIQDVLHEYNELYKVYKPIGLEVINDQNAVSMVIVDDFRKFTVTKGEKKLYDRPSVDDLAGLITQKGEKSFSRDIIIQKNDNNLQRISESHPANDPLSYALLFVKGDMGWSPEMTYKKSVKSTTANRERASAAREKNNSDLEPKQEPRTANTDSLKEHPTSKTIQLTASITLFMFMNFFLHVRKGYFNLLFKGK